MTYVFTGCISKLAVLRRIYYQYATEFYIHINTALWYFNSDVPSRLYLKYLTCHVMHFKFGQTFRRENKTLSSVEEVSHFVAFLFRLLRVTM